MADMKVVRKEITALKRAQREQARKEFAAAPLSKVIRLAVADLEAVEKMRDKYKIDMSVYHVHPKSDEGYYILSAMTDEDEDRCHVCLAGTVIANTFNARRGHTVGLGSYGAAAEKRFRALDMVRCGEFHTAAMTLAEREVDPSSFGEAAIAAGNKAQAVTGHIRVPEYAPEISGIFRLALLNAATALEKAGL